MATVAKTCRETQRVLAVGRGISSRKRLAPDEIGYAGYGVEGKKLARHELSGKMGAHSQLHGSLGKG
jgi:hypothetical protein